MAKTTVYSFAQVSASVDGVLVRGLFDGDDAVSVTPNADVGSLLVGAGGCSTFSQSADRSAVISLKLQHGSPTHRQLSQKLKRQRAGGTVSGFSFSVLDTGSNEGGNSDVCFIQQAPSDDKGKVATVREWILITGDWNETIPNG